MSEDNPVNNNEEAVTKLSDRPRRRDVQALTEVTSELEVGDYVSAEFKTKRYGYFKITGVLIETMDKNSLVIGSWIVCNDGKPTKDLQTVVLKAKDGTHEYVTNSSEESEDYGPN